MGHRSFRSAVSSLAAVALLVAQTPATRAAHPLTRADYEACQAQDEEGVRTAIAALTLKGLEAGLANLDYGPLVADAWRREKFDETIDRQVDEAIAQVRDESSWYQLWSSLASRDSAQELATSAAERVYRADAVKQGIGRIAADVGKEIGKRIELAVVDTAGPATQCMQAFLGRRYGATVAFHGHAHRGAPEGRTQGGVPVYNVAMPLLRRTQPDALPVRFLTLPVAPREAEPVR